MQNQFQELAREKTLGATRCLALKNLGLSFVVGLLLRGWSILCSEANAQDGVPLWTNRFTGPASGFATANAIAVDNSGNVIVTGSWSDLAGHQEYATVKYSSAGEPWWTNYFDGGGYNLGAATSVAVNSNGDVFVTGYEFLNASDFEHATIKYSSAGAPVWTNRFEGANTFGTATFVAVDRRGDVIVTGCSAGASLDYVTVKYSGAGIPLWTNRFNRPGDSADYVSALSVVSNDVVVTGFSLGGAITGENYSTVRYSSAGVALWTNDYSGLGNSYDAATAVAADGTGNVFVTGRSFGDGSDDDYATIKYSNAGVPLWTNRYNGPGNSSDVARAVATDTNGNVVVVGSSSGDTNHGSLEYATIKYSRSGVPLWTNRYHGPASGPAQAIAMALDSKSDVYVTGYSSANGSDSDNDYATIKYSSAGVPLWTNTYHGPGSSQAAAIAVDNSDNVFVTGTSGNEWATIKYCSSSASVHLTLEPDGSGGYFVRFTGTPDETYHLQRAPTVGGPWATIQSQTAPASGLIEFWDLLPPPDQAYYRTLNP